MHGVSFLDFEQSFSQCQLHKLCSLAARFGGAVFVIETWAVLLSVIVVMIPMAGHIASEVVPVEINVNFHWLWILLSAICGNFLNFPAGRNLAVIWQGYTGDIINILYETSSLFWTLGKNLPNVLVQILSVFGNVKFKSHTWLTNKWLNSASQVRSHIQTKHEIKHSASNGT